jgi:RNA polymerase sigma factor (sigma-70 family)
MASGHRDALLGQLRALAGASEPGVLTDRTLLERFVEAGDEAAFTEVVRRHSSLVLRVCRTILRNRDDAEDAFQATFLVLARKAASLAWRESVAGWLHGVACRVARKARTAAARRRVHESRAEIRPPASPSVDELTLREAQELLDEELARLPEKYRSPVVLVYLEGATQEEAARRCGWSLSTLKRRLHRAEALLQARLSRRDLTLAALLSVSLLTRAPASAALVGGAVMAAGLLRAGGAGAANVTKAAALAEAVLRSMLLARLKVAVVVLAVLVLATGVGWGAFRVSGVRTPIPEQAGTARSAAAVAAAQARPEEDLPRPVLVRLGTTRLRHAAPVEGVAFSADGTRVVSCAGEPDGTLRLWESHSGKEVWRQPLPGGVRAVAVSRDGRLLATGGADRVVRLWKPGSRQAVLLLRGHAGSVSSLVFTPDGKTVISGSLDGIVRLWDCSSGKERQRLPTPGYRIRSLALTRDGKLLAVGCEGPPVSRARFAAGHPVRLWDLPSGKERPALHKHTGPVQALAFSPDGKMLASGGIDTSTALWEVTGGRLLREVRPFDWGGFGMVHALAFSPDGRTLALGCSENTVYLVDPRTGKRRHSLLSLRLGGDPLSTPDDKQWPRAGGVLALAFAPDGQTLAAARGHAVRLWEMASAKERDFGGHRGGVSSVIFSPDGQTVATSGWDHTVRLWDARTGKERRQVFEPKAGSPLPQNPAALAFSPDGKTLAATTGNTARLLDLSTGKQVWQARIGSPGQQVAFTANGKALALLSHADGAVRLLDAGTGRVSRTVPGTSPPQAFLALSPNARLLAWWSPNQGGRLRETATGKEVGRFGSDKEPLHALAFSPDGAVLAAATGWPSGRPTPQPIQLWDTQGRELRKLVGHQQGPIHALAFAPGGRLLASAGDDRTVRLWDIRTGKELARFTGHQAAVASLAFSPDGQRLASASDDGTVLIWDATARPAPGRP